MKIDHAGTYLTYEDSLNVFVKEISGLKVSFLSYTYGTNSEYRNNVLASEIRYSVDLIREQDPFDLSLFEDKKSIITKIKVLYRLFFNENFRVKVNKFLFGKTENIGVIDSVNPNEINHPKNVPYLNRFLKKISKAKKESDLVVLYLHIGGQYNKEIGEYTNFIMDKAIEFGSDIIIGSHPHCVLPYRFDSKNSVLATFSLGDFYCTPFQPYHIHGVYAEYSIVLNAYISVYSKKIDKITFSITKVIRDSDDNTKVCLLYDLYNNEFDIKLKHNLFEDAERVVSKFIGKKPDNFGLEKEYDLYKLIK